MWQVVLWRSSLRDIHHGWVLNVQRLIIFNIFSSALKKIAIFRLIRIMNFSSIIHFHLFQCVLSYFLFAVTKAKKSMTNFHQSIIFSHTIRPDEFQVSLNSPRGRSKDRLPFLPFMVYYFIFNVLLPPSLRIRVNL